MMLTLRVVIAGLFLAAACVPVPAAAEPVRGTALHLVDLIKPQESQALAVRFMTAISPLPLPEGVADCTVARATPAIKEYIAAVYAKNLTEPDLRAAVTFFESKEGQSVIALRLQHERNLYEAAARGEQIAGEEPEYPPQVRKALEKFAATATGKTLTGKDELIFTQPFRSEISDLRDSALAMCIEELAAQKGGSAR